MYLFLNIQKHTVYANSTFRSEPDISNPNRSTISRYFFFYKEEVVHIACDKHFIFAQNFWNLACFTVKTVLIYHTYSVITQFPRHLQRSRKREIKWKRTYVLGPHFIGQFLLQLIFLSSIIISFVCLEIRKSKTCVSIKAKKWPTK